MHLLPILFSARFSTTKVQCIYINCNGPMTLFFSQIIVWHSRNGTSRFYLLIDLDKWIFHSGWIIKIHELKVGYRYTLHMHTHSTYVCMWTCALHTHTHVHTLFHNNLTPLDKTRTVWAFAFLAITRYPLMLRYSWFSQFTRSLHLTAG